VYCERENDVALIFFRVFDAARKYRLPIEMLRAEPIEALIETPALQRVPFDSLTAEWRNGLEENYGSMGIAR
jgi:hypothetical protein